MQVWGQGVIQQGCPDTDQLSERGYIAKWGHEGHWQ